MISRCILCICLAAVFSAEAKIQGRELLLGGFEDDSDNVIERNELDMLLGGINDYKFSGPKTCQIEEIRKIDGHCKKMGARGPVACIAGDLIEPFHPMC